MNTNEKKTAFWAIRDIDLITDYADFDEKSKLKMIEDRIQKFWADNPSPDQSQEAQRQGATKILAKHYDEYIKSNGQPIPLYASKYLIAAMEEYADIQLNGFALMMGKADAAQPAEEWVAVEDGLPKAGYQVMAFNGFSQQIYLGSYLNGKWIFHGQERGNISHWRPLPAPPSSPNKK